MSLSITDALRRSSSERPINKILRVRVSFVLAFAGGRGLEKKSTQHQKTPRLEPRDLCETKDCGSKPVPQQPHRQAEQRGEYDEEYGRENHGSDNCE